MVSGGNGNVSPEPCFAPSNERFVDVSDSGTPPTDSTGVPSLSGLESVRQQAVADGFSEQAAQLLCDFGWRKGTSAAYNSAWKQWSSWCCKHKADPFRAPVADIVNYLSDRYHKGDQYRTLNSHRSAISAFHIPVEGLRVGQHAIVTKIMSAFFNARPPMPKYIVTWEVDKVLTYISQLGSNEGLLNKDLTLKLAMLLALTSAGRSSELNALDLRFMQLDHDKVNFELSKLTKSRRKGQPPIRLTISSFPDNGNLCVIQCLMAYLARSRSWRYHEGVLLEPQLFLSYIKPHKKVVSCTIAGWLVTLMFNAGIDTSVFKAHSTRGASSSKAKALGLSCRDIMERAKWKKVSTFKRHYLREMTGTGDKFTSKVLTVQKRL